MTAIDSAGTGGDWNDTASWSPAQIPTAGDRVTILAGDTITLTQNESAGSVTINSTGIIIGGGYKLTLNDAAGSTFIFSCVGTISAASTLDIDITGGSADRPINEAGTGSINNLLINNAQTYKMHYHLNLLGTLTLTSGTLTTNNGSSDMDLTVAGDTLINGGTLTCNSSDVNLRSGGSGGTWGLRVNSGTFTGGTGTHNIGGVTLRGGSLVWSNGTTTLNGGETSSSASTLYASAGTFTNGTGTVVVDTSSTLQWLLYGADINVYNLTIASGSTLRLWQPTSDGSGARLLTVAGALTITGDLTTKFGSQDDVNLTVTGQCAVSGTLTCNSSAISVGSGLTNTLGMLVQTNGTLTGGTGAHTYGTFNADASGTVNVTLTAGITTINGSYTDGIAWAMRNGVTFNNGGGDIHFTGSGNQYLYERNNTARTLGDVTVNKSGGNFQWYDSGGAHYTMASLTITQGTFDTNEHDGANPRDLTVTGATSITGTLTCNSSAINLGDNVDDAWSVVLEAGGTFTGGSGTHRLGAVTLNSSSNQFTFSSGTTFLTGRSSSGNQYKVFNNFTAGKVTAAGTQTVDQARTPTSIRCDDTTGINNLTMNSGTGRVLHIENDLTTVGNINISAGTISTRNHQDNTDYDLTSGGYIHGAGTLAANSSDIRIAASNDIQTQMTGVAPDFAASTGGINKFGFNGDVAFTGAMTVTCGSVGGNWTNAGTSTVTISNHNNKTNNQTGSLYNLTINNAGNTTKCSSTQTILGAFTITAGTFDMMNQVLTVTGATSITGILDAHTNGDPAITLGVLSIETGGQYKATSGTTILLGNFTDAGTFTHNDGTVSTAAGTAILLLGTSNTAFYDIKSASTGSGVSTFKQYTNKTVEHDMITGSKELQWQLNTNDVVLTLGTTGYASQIDADYFDGTVVANQYVQSASESYPAVFKSTIQFLRFTGHTGQAGYMPTNAHIKWVDIQKAVTTPGDTKTITLGGKCEFDGVSVSNGDTIAVDTHELEFSGAFDGDGTVTVSTGQIVGTSNDYRPAVTTITDNAYIQAGDQLGSAFTITASKYPVLKGKRLYTGGGVDFSSSNFRNSSIIINGTETNYLVGDNFNNILVNNASGIETQLAGARTIKGSLRVGGIGKFDTQNNTLDIEGDIRQMKGSTLELGNSTVRCTGSANFIGGFIGDSLLTFDGTNDKCSSTAAAANFTAIDSSNNFTCEGWIKASSASNYEHILSRGTSWGTGNITVYMNSAGNIQASLNADGSSANTLTSVSSGLADNRWHHFAYTYDQTNLKLYINGRLEASAAFTTAISASSTGFELGTRGGTTNTWFGGEMARISIWSSALTAVQIRKMMFENFATATTTNCLAWWQMDDRFGATLDDEVGSVDLTVSDTAMWNSPEGSFDDGGSTFTMKGNNTYLWFSPDQTFYNLGLAPGSKTTNISGRSNNNAINVANTLTLGGGTLTQTPQSVELHLNSTGTPITQDGTTSLAQIYRTLFNGAGATITAGTYDFIYPNAANQKLGGNVTGSNCLVSNNASLDLNTKQLSLSTKLELNDNSTLTLNSNAELLFTGASSQFDSNATSILSAGPGAIINGVSTKSTFKSQSNFEVVGNIANLNVTNEELVVAGTVTNCTGDIIQWHHSQDYEQRLDTDTADDRDLSLGGPALDNANALNN